MIKYNFSLCGAFIPMITIHDAVLSIYQTYIHLGKARGRSNCCAGFCCNRSNCQYTYDQWCKQRLHRTTKRLKVRDLLFFLHFALHCNPCVALIAFMQSWRMNEWYENMLPNWNILFLHKYIITIISSTISVLMCFHI